MRREQSIMTLKQERLMEALRAGGPMTSRQLRDATGARSTSDVTRTCRSLERFGFVKGTAYDRPNGQVGYAWALTEESA